MNNPIVRPSAVYNTTTGEYDCSVTRDQAILSAAISSCFGSGEADKAIISVCRRSLDPNQQYHFDAHIRIRGTLKTQKPRVCSVKAKDNYRAALIEILSDAAVPQSVKDRIRIKFTAESARRHGFDTKTILTSVEPAVRETIEGMDRSLPEEVTYPPSVSGTVTWETVGVPATHSEPERIPVGTGGTAIIKMSKEDKPSPRKRVSSR
jgi:hypothetical protein